jgi:hypothetical protein
MKLGKQTYIANYDNTKQNNKVTNPWRAAPKKISALIMHTTFLPIKLTPRAKTGT